MFKEDKKRYMKDDVIPLNIVMPKSAKSMHVICIKNKHKWDYSFIVHDAFGNPIRDGFFSCADDNHDNNLKSQFK